MLVAGVEGIRVARALIIKESVPAKFGIIAMSLETLDQSVYEGVVLTVRSSLMILDRSWLIQGELARLLWKIMKSLSSEGQIGLSSSSSASRMAIAFTQRIRGN